MQSATEKAATSEQQKGTCHIDLSDAIKTKKAAINVKTRKPPHLNHKEEWDISTYPNLLSLKKQL